MTDTLNVEKREQTGTLRMRRLRASGMIPAVLYGHGGENLSLQIPTKDVNAAIRHGNQFVELKGAVNESALISEVQWDTFGTDVLHLDLTRVDAAEKVDVTVAVELVGEAPGTKVGGILNQPLHEIQIQCSASSLPDKLEIRINGLGLNQTMTAGDVPLPAGATLVTSADEIVVQCGEPSQAADTEASEASFAAEPEVIGRKESEEDSDE